MQPQPPQLPPQPPGAINALLNGFNAVASHIGVILFPVAFDVLLWLGPRLTVTTLFAPLIQDIAQLQATMKDLPVTPEFLTEFWNGFNLLSILRTYPLGIFSLMSVNLAGASPLGLRTSWDIHSLALVMLLLPALTFLGWLGGSLYFYFVSQVALNAKDGLKMLPAILHSLLISALWAFAGTLASLPAFFLLGILFLINQMMGIIFYILVSLFIVWFTIPVFFSLHGVFIRAQNAFVSVWQSFRIVRFGLPSLSWFALMAVVISQGMDMLWRVPPADSWMALVGILGHAFISTSLLAASFIFYRDMQSWVDAALQWIKTNQITSARA